jgi:chemotaxis-related protein WspB
MLHLLFRLGEDRYALAARQIVAVLPLLATRALAGTPAWVSGVLEFRGAIVPTLDLSMLALGRSARARLSTRTVVVEYRPSVPPEQAPAAGSAHWLALILEQATETLNCAPEAFVASGVSTPQARYLGPVMQDARGLIQRVEVAQLLPEAVQALLFNAETNTP